MGGGLLVSDVVWKVVWNAVTDGSTRTGVGELWHKIAGQESWLHDEA